MTFDEWWDTTKAAATPETFAGWEHSCRQAWSVGRADERERMRALIADDAAAMTFQTMGQYRSALLQALKA